MPIGNREKKLESIQFLTIFVIFRLTFAINATYKHRFVRTTYQDNWLIDKLTIQTEIVKKCANSMYIKADNCCPLMNTHASHSQD